MERTYFEFLNAGCTLALNFAICMTSPAAPLTQDSPEGSWIGGVQAAVLCPPTPSPCAGVGSFPRCVVSHFNSFGLQATKNHNGTCRTEIAWPGLGVLQVGVQDSEHL